MAIACLPRDNRVSKLSLPLLTACLKRPQWKPGRDMVAKWCASLLVFVSLIFAGCSPLSKTQVSQYDAAVRTAVQAVPGVTAAVTSFKYESLGGKQALSITVTTDLPSRAQRLTLLNNVLKVAADVLRPEKLVFAVDAVVLGVGEAEVSSRDLRVDTSADLYRRFPGDFSPSRDGAKAQGYDQHLHDAAMAVPGVTGGSITFADGGVDLGVWLRFTLTTTATSRTQRLAVLDQVLRASEDIVRSSGVGFWVAGSMTSTAPSGTSAGAGSASTAEDLRIFGSADMGDNYGAAVHGSPRVAGSAGLTLATQGDAAGLSAQVAALGHVSGVYLSFRDQRLEALRGSCLYIDTDLPEVGVDGVDTLKSPAFAQLITQIKKVVWAQPFDLGDTCISVSAAGSLVVDAGTFSLYSLQKEFGRPPGNPTTSPAATPTPS